MIQGANGLVADSKGRGTSGGDKPARKKKPGGPDSHVANALKTAYEETVGESVPDEFMDLLGKLS
ncbi:NepR family anti-sigma factor [Sphingomonas sp. BIUV-7]|uniref:NepR family anti-sigma factor n=1 Tax=Sphingomonas natans TaxID=3063330 RepID=A0ABT8Y6B0_9SPHN|nr:NepR family anti-sigma factor [Sphingomonas sp. BIUV-7]MDO6413841.1 NepR family anti-sigma factor [Sphingomonas sp. BIUV-7]